MKTFLPLALCALSAAAAVPNPSVHSVRFSGSQYVDTGVPARTGVKIELVAAWDNPGSDNGVFGARVDNTRFYPVHVYGNKLSYGAGDFKQLSTSIAANTVYTIVSDFADDLQTISLDGTTVWTGTPATGLSLSGKTLYLGAVNYTGDKAYYNCWMTVYSARIWLDGDLVRDYRPDFRNGVAGFYDAVNGTWNPSAGQNGFFVVPRWTPGPPDSLVEWIAGSGWTHGIDTMVRARSDLAFEGKMRWNYVDASAGGREYAFLGALWSKNKYLEAVHVVSNQLWFAYGNGQAYGEVRFFLTNPNGTPATVTAGTDHEFRAVLAAGEQSLVWDGVTVHSGTRAESVDVGGNVAVLATQEGGGFGYSASARCYRLKIWQDDVLVRDLVPGVKDGEGVLYDKVDGICLYSWNPIGPANIGPPLAAPTRPVRFCEYVGSTGTQYVDTGVEGRAGTKIETTLEWTNANGDRGVIGSRKDWGDTRFYPIHTNGDLCYGYGRFNHIGKTIPANEKHVIETDFRAGSQTVTLDGTNVVSGTSSTDIRTGRPMYLYADNAVGTADYFSYVRVYELKIWQDDVLVRHFVPVIADNGAPYLWDKISKSLFGSETDTAFWDCGEIGGSFEQGTVILVR